MITRRVFIEQGGAAMATMALATRIGVADEPKRVSSDDEKPWLRKSLKSGMIRAKNASMVERFEIALQAGFEGIEPNTGTFDPDEAKAAAEATGLIIDGTVCGDHWKIRHTDPDPEVRRKALASLIAGIEHTAAVGADTILLVPGKGEDGDDETIYKRAIENISLALPTAEKNGVSILMENVWNDFLYDHEGGNDQSAERLAKFVDDFGSPYVGVQFDIGNHWKYGDPAKWIRTLGDRIKKLDIKGFSRATGKFTPITLGDIDWPSVEMALHDIHYIGWLAAEVGGGDLEHLTTVASQMEAALNCSTKAATFG
jgi:hexulose-6-phosphate isomerase